MSRSEWRATLGLASIFGLRMLGLFIILPVFALYAVNLPGGQDKVLVGLALGAYAYTQALLQLPFGWLSDRYGRKRMLYIGLAIFAAGSFVAAVAQDIYWIIFGRVIQGAGAISAVAVAFVADLTREQHRTKAMALIGSTIGVTFALSIVLGPVFNRWIGVPGIFVLIGALALLAMLVTYAVVPDAPRATRLRPQRNEFARVLGDANLWRLNYGIFALHAVLMAMFLVVPFALIDNALPSGKHWQVYLPVMLISFALMVPAVIAADRGDTLKRVFIGAVALLVVAQFALGALLQSFWGVVIALLIFFTAFNVLEASLPSLVSRMAPPDAKGTATGVYSSIQFLGAAVGPTVGGWLWKHAGTWAVFAFCGVLSLIWLIVAAPMRLPDRAARTRHRRDAAAQVSEGHSA